MRTSRVEQDDSVDSVGDSLTGLQDVKGDVGDPVRSKSIVISRIPYTVYKL